MIRIGYNIVKIHNEVEVFNLLIKPENFFTDFRTNFLEKAYKALGKAGIVINGSPCVWRQSDQQYSNRGLFSTFDETIIVALKNDPSGVVAILEVKDSVDAQEVEAIYESIQGAINSLIRDLRIDCLVDYKTKVDKNRFETVLFASGTNSEHVKSLRIAFNQMVGDLKDPLLTKYFHTIFYISPPRMVAKEVIVNKRGNIFQQEPLYFAINKLEDVNLFEIKLKEVTRRRNVIIDNVLNIFQDSSVFSFYSQTDERIYFLDQSIIFRIAPSYAHSTIQFTLNFNDQSEFILNQHDEIPSAIRELIAKAIQESTTDQGVNTSFSIYPSPPVRLINDVLFNHLSRSTNNSPFCHEAHMRMEVFNKTSEDLYALSTRLLNNPYVDVTPKLLDDLSPYSGDFHRHTCTAIQIDDVTILHETQLENSIAQIKYHITFFTGEEYKKWLNNRKNTLRLRSFF